MRFVYTRKDFLHGAILLLIIAAGLFLRVDIFRNAIGFLHEYPDYSRDYLVAHHMSHYGEIPFSPPQTSALGTALGSPFYFYFLAFLVSIWNNMLFLGFVNIFLQVSVIFGVYFLARALFGGDTALISAALFSFSTGIINQSAFPWQPHFMQFFVVASYALLAWSYLRKKYVLTFVSTVLFAIATVLHVSVFALLLIFAFAVYLMFRSHQKRFLYFVYTILVFAGTLTLLYIPRSMAPPSVSPSASRFIFDITNGHHIIISLLENILPRTVRFFEFFLPETSNFFINASTVVLFAATIYYFIGLKKDRAQKFYTAFFIFAIVQFLIAAAILSNDPTNPFPVRYFTPIFCLFIIFIAELINSIFSRLPGAVIIKTVMCVFALSLLSPHLPQRVAAAASRSFYPITYRIDPAVEAVKKKIVEIQQKEKREFSLSFFQIKGYRIYYSDEDFFWNTLEHEFNFPFTRVSDIAMRDYQPMNNDTYMFLICPYQKEYDERRDCRELFSAEYSSYAPAQQIYSSHPYKIYLTQKQTSKGLKRK